MKVSASKVLGESGNTWSRVLTVVLVIAILGALGMLGYVVAVPKTGERFTEFYILGLGGMATEYPEEIKVGEEAKVIVGIVNRQQEITSYRLEVRIDGVKYNETEPLVLESGEKWEGIIGFAVASSGDNKRVEFLLYRNNDATPYLKPLYLWVNVTE